MNGIKLTLSLSLLAVASTALTAPAEMNWNQWRGPNATGVAPSGNPPTEWSETKNINGSGDSR